VGFASRGTCHICSGQLGDVGGDAPRLVAGEQLDYCKGPGSRRQDFALQPQLLIYIKALGITVLFRFPKLKQIVEGGEQCDSQQR
jgi:hypothetical protein